MPDFTNYGLTAQPDGKLVINPTSVTPNAPTAGNTTIVAPTTRVFDIPIIRAQGQVRNSQTGALIQDFTGANSIDFALRVQGLNTAQHRELAELVAQTIMRRLVGLE
jgi:hypothetical protein